VLPRDKSGRSPPHSPAGENRFPQRRHLCLGEPIPASPLPETVDQDARVPDESGVGKRTLARESPCACCVPRRSCQPTTHHRADARHLSGPVSAGVSFTAPVPESVQDCRIGCGSDAGTCHESSDLQKPDYSSRCGIRSFPKKLTIEKSVRFQCATPSAPVTTCQTRTPSWTRGAPRKSYPNKRCHSGSR
jgi:hypothetical protein